MESYSHYHGSVYDKYFYFRLFVLKSLESIPYFSDFVKSLKGNEDENYNSFCLEFYELDYDGLEGNCYSKWSVNYSPFGNDVPTIKLFFRGYYSESLYVVKNLKTEEILNLFTDEYFSFVNILRGDEISDFNVIGIEHHVDKYNYWLNLFVKDLENKFPNYKFEFIFDCDSE